MSVRRVNAHAKYRYQVDLTTPDANGVLATPAAGTVTGILLRLASTENGPAIHASLNALPAAETTGTAGRFFVEVSQALHETHILPLGVGVTFWAVWSRAGEFDAQNVAFVVDDGVTVP